MTIVYGASLVRGGHNDCNPSLLLWGEFFCIALRPLGQFDFVFSDLFQLKTPLLRAVVIFASPFQFDNIGRCRSNSFSIPPCVTDNSILAILARIQEDRKENFSCSSVEHIFFHLIWDSTWFIWFTFLNFLVVTIFWPHRSNVGNGRAVGRLAAESA